MSVRLSRIEANPETAVAGVDVGEDFLDFAIIERGWKRIEYRRVGLRGIDSAALDSLRERIVAAAPMLTPGAIAIVDSPRWPRDLDASCGGDSPRESVVSGREIDRALRVIYRRIAAAEGGNPRLAMFPSPRLDYFLGCVAHPACKPHLRRIGRELFGNSRQTPAPIEKPGMLFTRFMLAGFALYRALEAGGIEALESFPDLQFRLCAPRRELISKQRGHAALAMRRRIAGRLFAQLEICGAPPATIDLADAAIMALCFVMAARGGTILALECAAEGRFLLALTGAQAGLFQADENAA
ncbi:MAG: hypothetical protein ACREP6_07690 [Candidatus Binataceae bacterium]